MSVHIEIRQATAADAGAIHDVHTNSVRELCKEHYTLVQIDGWLKHRQPDRYLAGIEGGEMFVAVAKSQIVGFGHAVPGEVLAIFVSPQSVGEGVGKSLLKHAMQLARCNGEKVVRLESALNAQGFYERAGFVTVREQFVQRNDVLLPVVVMEWRSEIEQSKDWSDDSSFCNLIGPA